MESLEGETLGKGYIFLTKDGGVKLLDFGAARSAAGTHSKSLAVLYKEGFTAEEQYQSRVGAGILDGCLLRCNVNVDGYLHAMEMVMTVIRMRDH